MTILQALNGYYERMAVRGEAERLGFSREKISFVIVLSPQGDVLDILDIRDANGKKRLPRSVDVPAAVKRTAGISPNMFWDKSAYVLGRTGGEGRRTADEHTAFKSAHLSLLSHEVDTGLAALRLFLERWTSEQFDAPPFEGLAYKDDILDANIVFRLDGDLNYLHERLAAQKFFTSNVSDEDATISCLITGQRAQAERLHPTIKGVDGAQSSGAALVSFNLDAFTSYSKSQGDNAPTSQAAAFRYGAALNRLLDRGVSRQRLKIGDATVVFWADASGVGEAAADAAEVAALSWFGSPSTFNATETDQQEAVKLRDVLKEVGKGRPLSDLGLGLRDGTQFHILGLAPNAARLSVRYWLTDSFDVFARRLAQHDEDLKIEPRPWKNPPSVDYLLRRTTALQDKRENVPNALAGEVIRTVLTGSRYPRTLLSAAIMRLRAGDDPATGWHAAVIKAVLTRELRLSLASDSTFNPSNEGLPVSLDRTNEHPAYQLGRLFAVMETAQRLALGKGVKATIRDRYFGAASATPASVFPLLMRGVQNHLGKLRKERKGGWIETDLEEIADRLGSELPRALKLEAQGRFVLGYYHQRKYRPADPKAQAEIESINNDKEGDDND